LVKAHISAVTFPYTPRTVSGCERLKKLDKITPGLFYLVRGFWVSTVVDKKFNHLLGRSFFQGILQRWAFKLRKTKEKQGRVRQLV
jgi:hypothetical protein